MKLSAGLFLLLVFIPYAAADVIEPGHKYISVHNRIIGIDNYPDYIFIGVAKSGESPCMLYTPIQVLNEGDEINTVYKLCTVSIYGIEKKNFDENLINFEGNNETLKIIYQNNLDLYLRNYGKEVIKGIETSASVPVSSSENEINNFYSVDLGVLKDKPDDASIERSYMIYVYLGAALVALALIIFLLLRRHRRNGK